jgi:NAD(P)-dependent dehydrogenase (short-subunit alcohol dehydrogenase family)
MNGKKNISPKDKYGKPPFKQGTQKYPGTESAMHPQPEYASYTGYGRLKGKVALITGGDSGIGRAVAVAYAKEGANVVISYLSLEEKEDAQTTIRAIEEAGQQGLAIVGDIQNEDHCKSLIEQTIEKFAGLDILVNNAAFQLFHTSFLEISSEEFDRAFKTNVYAMFYLCKEALPKMPEGGAIINTTSVQAFSPSPTLLHYASTKGAIVTFTKALAQEAAKSGIRVNAVAPGPVWTPLIPATSIKDEDVSQFGKETLWERPAQPVELAPLYVLLASDEGSYITGEIYPITGSIKVI